MTREDAIRMIKAKLECKTRDESGAYDDCNFCYCEECHLNYEMGTMDEQMECLRMSIEALEQTSALDNAREEIEKQKECRCFDDDDMYIYMTGLNDAIDIIDKYRAESEEV